MKKRIIIVSAILILAGAGLGLWYENQKPPFEFLKGREMVGSHNDYNQEVSVLKDACDFGIEGTVWVRVAKELVSTNGYNPPSVVGSPSPSSATNTPRTNQVILIP